MGDAVDKCYLCLEDATAERQFIDPNPCNCKGTIKLHSSCAKEVINNTTNCGICKTKWRYTGIKRFYPPNRIEEYTYVNGLRHGPYKEYYLDGKVKEEGTYVNNNKEGSCKRYFDNGVLKEDFNYINNKREGPYKYYYISGALEMEGTFINDNAYNASGKIYYENGIVKEEHKVYEVNGVKYTEYKDYYENGQLHFERTITNEYKRHGLSKTYYRNGQIKSEANYVDGRIEGINKTYYANGVVASEINYVHNRVNGVAKKYHKNGILQEEFHYVNGLLNGYSKQYYDDGSLSYKKEPGHYWAYFPNGTLKEEVTCIASGRRIGVWDGIRSLYNEDGTLVKQENYVDGRFIGTV